MPFMRKHREVQFLVLKVLKDRQEMTVHKVQLD